MIRRQKERGFLSDDDLRALAEELRVPLYRLEGLASFYPHFRRTPPARATIAVCRDLSCHLRLGAGGGAGLADRVRAALGERDDVEVREVSCIGRCDAAPAALVNEIPVGPVEPAGLASMATDPARIPAPADSAPRRFGFDPYQSDGDRYGALRVFADGAVLVTALKDAGLRGMGGAGFPTGTKWDLVRKEAATPKYVICNADESEPGTFKDREVLRHASHLVIEGMALAARVVGAARGIVYLRHEYGPEEEALERALHDARARGALGDPFDVEVFVSPGGYILGEETALLEALEDRRGEPRNKPPFPGQKGLFGQPTLINNVETFAMVPAIALRGADWWKAEGVRGCPGRKLVAVSGHVAAPGVYEVPMGTTVGELLALAGGMQQGRRLLAFAPGGASSNFLPADKLDVPLDFKALADAGSMLGSGAVVYVAEGTNLLDVARNVTAFFRNESCGKCVPCRVGSEKGVAILDDATAGGGSRSGLALLSDLNETLAKTSICGLGQVALGPALSLIRNFPREIEP